MAPLTARSVMVRANRADWFVLALLAISLVTNVVLGVTVLRLANRAAASAARRPEGRSAPAIGALLPALDARRVDGRPELISFEPGARPTLLYVFAPSCRWCAMNLENVKAVFAAAGKTHRILALSLAPHVGTAVADFPTHVRVLVQPGPTAYEAYRFGSTPATLVISPEGRVLKAWVGAYSGEVGEEVASYFSARLPGLLLQAPD